MKEDIVDQYRCRVCGRHQGFRSWGSDMRSPSFETCDCCGTRFGFQDSSPKKIKKYREEWIKKGAPWHRPDQKLRDWTLEEQLTLIPYRFRDEQLDV